MVYTTVNTSTLAFKPSKSHFLPAHETKILSLFWFFKRLGFALQTAAMPFLILKFAGLLFSVLLCPKMYCPLGKTLQILIKVTAVVQGLSYIDEDVESSAAWASGTLPSVLWAGKDSDRQVTEGTGGLILPSLFWTAIWRCSLLHWIHAIRTRVSIKSAASRTKQRHLAVISFLSHVPLLCTCWRLSAWHAARCHRYPPVNGHGEAAEPCSLRAHHHWPLRTPVFLPGEFHGQRSLVGASP